MKVGEVIAEHKQVSQPENRGATLLCWTYCIHIAPLAVLHLLHWYLAVSCVAPITLVLCLWLCCTYYTGIAWFCIDIALLAVLQLLHWYFAFSCVAPITLVLGL